ncbi:MAG: 50S ribosomal protein L13 [bacterium]
MKKNKTVYARKETVVRDWYVVDAAGKVLGRMATKIATYLRGKHKAIFTPHTDAGDFIILLNADKVRVTGNKAEQKIYFTHSDYPGGDRKTSFAKMMSKDSRKVIRQAVSGMLPKTRLGRQMIKKLKIYKGDKHPHQTQNLKSLEV